MNQFFGPAAPGTAAPAAAPQGASQGGQKKLLVTVAVIVVVAVIAAAAYWFLGPKETTQQLADGTEKVTAPAGKVVSGFPKDLVLDAAGSPDESYALIYKSQNVSQPTVAYVSSKSYADTIADFDAWLRANGWSISREGTPQETANTFFYAFKGSDEVNISITRDITNKVSITIAYVTR